MADEEKQLTESKVTPLPNIAFVDAQNMHFGTTKCGACAKKIGKPLKEISLVDCTCGVAWEIDLAKLRVYLKENYNVAEAYYFLGYVQEKHEELYQDIQKAGFILVFKEHNVKAKSKKKGNVDTDIVFEVMKNLIDNTNFDQIVLISGDGDYKKLVSYLISKNKFKKILFPNKTFASSLYKQFGGEKFDFLENLKTYIRK